MPPITRIVHLKVRWSHLIPITILGFASGLPLALTGTTLQAWYTQSGVSLTDIGLLTLVGLPYVCKPIWAPLFDRFQLPCLGRRRGWLLLIQFLCAGILIWMANQSPVLHARWLAGIACLLAFASASQDVVYDGYRTDLLAEDERSMGAACGIGGYRVAMLVSGGLGLVVASHVGWILTYYFMAMLMVLCAVVTWLAPEPHYEDAPPRTIAAAVVEPFKQFLSRPMAWCILLLIVMYKIGDAFVLSMGTTFLMRKMHFTLTDIGLVYKSVGMGATLLGVFVGGILQPRMGLYKSLWVFGILQSVSNFSFVALLFVGKYLWMLAATIFTENFCGGLGSAVFVAFLMTLCDRRYSATQFALLSAVASVGRVFIGPLAAMVIAAQGWLMYFLWSFVISLPCLALLWWLRRHPVFQPQTTSD